MSESSGKGLEVFPEWLRLGARVLYHPVLGEPHNGRVYTVRAVQIAASGHAVAWLDGKSGFVAARNLSPTAAAEENR